MNDIKNNRYPGTKSFTEAQKHLFYGREQEQMALLKQIRFHQMVVLYSKSGLGKTSLLNASVVPSIIAAHKTTVFPTRFTAWTSHTLPIEMPVNKMLNVLMPTAHSILETINDNTLWVALKTRQLITHQNHFLWVFDQFEELFTYPDAAIDAFKMQLAELLWSGLPHRFQNHLQELNLSEAALDIIYEPATVKVLFAIRADRMHLLDRLSDVLPDILRHCFELKALTEPMARQAIVAPARAIGDFASLPFEYDDAALQNIIQFLCDEDGLIEAIQLQTLCQAFEQTIKAPDLRIGVAHTQPKRLAVLIDQYYHTRLLDPCISDPKMAQRIIEDELVTVSSEGKAVRVTLPELYLQSKFESSTLKSVLDALVNVHLLRREVGVRGGDTYELAHDRLIEPVLEAKQVRLEFEQAEQQKKQAQELAHAARQVKAAYAGIALITTLLVTVVILFFYVQRAKTKAEIAEQNALSVLDKIYFYKNEFGLAYESSNNKYGFIDKNLNTKIKFKYNTALPFDQDGFAVVTRKNAHNIDTNFLIDTIGIEYQLATNIQQLDSNTIALDLRGRNLRKIPEKVFQQPQLKILLINNNNIDSLDRHIGLLRHLIYLDLSGNQLSKLPTSIGLLENLEYLDLNRNSIEKLPNEIGQLKNLKYLDLRKNLITHLPSTIGELQNLEVFVPSYTWLAEIPNEIGQLKNLRKLYLSYTSLKKLPDVIGELPKLEYLDLQFEEPISLSPTICNWKNIKQIRIFANISLPDCLKRI
ncbi:MAG: hypothetical protein RLZZ628_1404 [Bacteroidota bacterium]|jgi:Leucine-rich repeat (LRR) protein